MTRRTLVASLLLPLFLGGPAMALDRADIPDDAPGDAIMAAPEEVKAVSAWASAAFAGREPVGMPPRVKLELRRQDHNVLRFG